MFSTNNFLPKRIVVALLLNCVFQLQSATLLDTSKKFFSPGRNEREEQLEHLKTDATAWQMSNQEQLKTIATQLELNDRSLVEEKNQLKSAQGIEADFLNKKISLRNEIHQALFNNQLTRKAISGDLQQHIKELETYRKDPTLKSLIIEPRAVTNFESVQNLNKKVLYQEAAVQQITAQKNDALVELDSLKKKHTVAIKEYQEKKRAQEDFGTKTVTLFKEFNFQQRGELLDLTERLANYERQVAELKVREMISRISLINTKIFLETEKLKVLKENLNRIKGALRVSESEVTVAKEKLEKKKTETLAAKEQLYQEIKILTVQRDQLKRELEFLSKRYAITERDVAAWSVSTKTPEAYSALAEIGFKSAQIMLLDRRIEYLHAQIDLEDATFKRQEINFFILSMWYQLTQRRLKTGDEVAQHVKRFKELQAEAQRELALMQDRRNAATNLLNLQNKELTNLKNFMQEVLNEQELLFKRYPTRFMALAQRLSEVERVMIEQIESTSKLIEVESNLIATLDETTKELSFVLGELETKSIWQRSEYAISWQGIRQVVPDLKLFSSDLQQLGYNASTKFKLGSIVGALKNGVQRPLMLILIIIAIFCLVIAYALGQRLVRALRAWFLSSTPIARLVFYANRIAGMALFCVEKHFFGLFIWSVFFSLFSFGLINDLFARVLFYLVSIAYFLYVATNSKSLIIGMNRNLNYPLFNKNFEHRFSIVFLVFSYVTICTLLFREAFIAATIHKSEFPTILLATYSLFLRIMIIFSIGKDEVVTFISRQGTFGNWIAKYIGAYYYLLLAGIIALMIVSDPYVGGYGNLISYAVWGIIGTLILMKLLMIANMYAKRFLATAYFATDEETMHERFAYAKTLYGLSVISVFIVMLFVAVMIGTRIWMIPITWADLGQIMNFQLFDTGVDKTTGQLIWFTPLKLFVVLSFIIGGFIIYSSSTDLYCD